MLNDKALIDFAKKQVEISTLQLNATKIFLENVCTELVPDSSEISWAYIEKLANMTGLSINGIRNRVSRKELIENIHYRRENPLQKKSRLIFNIAAVNDYLSGK